MAGNIKGITIEFRGDTTKLDKALRQVNNETRNIDKELRNVDKALKFNPTSIELWRQKQDLLKQKIGETKDKLDLLKQQQAAMDASGVDKNSVEYQKLKREIIETESKLKTFEGQLKSIGNVNLRAASEQFKEWGTTLDSAGKKMQGLSTAAAGVVASLGAIAYKAGTNADDLNTLSKVYGIGTADLQKYKYAADLVDVSVEDIAKSHVKLEKNMYSAANGSKTQAAAFEKLGVSVENADGSLRSGDEVYQDVITALGSMTNETERDALAQQLMGKSAANLNPLIEDQGETYKEVSDTMKKYNLDVVDQETLDRANEFNDSLDTMKLLGTAALAQVGSQLAAVFAPALEKVVGWFGKIAEWLGNLNPKVLAAIGVVAGALAVIAPVLMVLGKLAFSISSIITLVTTIGPAVVGALATAAPVIAAIAAIIAIGVLLYKNWDKIKEKAGKLKEYVIGAFKALKEGVKRLFKDIKDAMVAPIEAARDLIKGIIEKIKGFFDFDFKLPDLKTPHFTIDPPGWSIGDLLHGVIPSLDVDWYAQGGIFRSPSVIGVGEAGPEAVLPIEKLQEMLANMADSIVNGILTGNQLQAAGTGGEIKIVNYLYPNGPAMGEQTVRMYDQYKKILG